MSENNYEVKIINIENYMLKKIFQDHITHCAAPLHSADPLICVVESVRVII